MAKNRETGALGERLAIEFLIQKGYSIEHINWKGEGCEIDIIARQNKTWIFVEVKTRSSTGFGWPEHAVNASKKQHIARAANHFIYENKIEDEIRFDIVSIVKKAGEHDIYHIEDAFVP
jgi:putative endonuclease